MPSEDITFCGSECNRKSCSRHPSNIRNYNIDHSFAYLQGSEYCEKEHQNETNPV